MKSLFLRILVMLMVLLFNLAPRAWAESSDQNIELSDDAKGGIGCALLTGVTLLGSLASGPGELIMIAGGGSLSPSATAPLMVSLTATVFVAACGIGMAATPAVLWFSEQIGILFDGLLRYRETATIDSQHRSVPILTSINKLSQRVDADNYVAQPSH
ncbi:membrane hypothetical protein [Gammaproteobacteria bacterium]